MEFELSQSRPNDFDKIMCIFVKTSDLNKLLCALLFGIGTLAMSQSAPKYSNEFLNIGVDAAALGSSNAVVARSNDVNASYWNPAGLTEVEDRELSLMHASYFANIANYNFIGYAMKIDDKSAAAASLIRFGVDDILDTTQLIDDQGQINYNRISLFSAADYALTLSYGRKDVLKTFDYGVNAKIIRRIIGDFASSWGFGFDLGVRATSKGGWQFGIMARDITTTVNVWSFDEAKLADIQNAIEGQNQSVPRSTEITAPKLQMGVAKTFLFGYDYELQTELDMIVRFEQNNDLISTKAASMTPALGLQLGYQDLVFVRAGAGNFQYETSLDRQENLSFQPNIGLGFKYRGIEIDYALTDIGDQSIALYSNIFSLKLDFGTFK